MAEFDISSQSVFSQQIQPQLPLESQGKNPNQIYSNINDEGRPNGSRDVVATHKRRGRPLGAKNKPKEPTIITQESPNTIRAHLVEVQSGCDVFESLAAYTRKHQQGISVLSAVGRVTRVTLRDPTVVGAEIMPLQGHFEIMSLSGTFLPPYIRAAGATTLTVYLAGGQARVVGGNVVGPLIAYGPVMVIVAAFTFVPCERLPLDLNEQHVETEQPFLGDGIGGGGENSFLKSTSELPFFGMQNSQVSVDKWTGEMI